MQTITSQNQKASKLQDLFNSFAGSFLFVTIFSYLNLEDLPATWFWKALSIAILGGVISTLFAHYTKKLIHWFEETGRFLPGQWFRKLMYKIKEKLSNNG